MKTEVRVVGYDSRTERVAFQAKVPHRVLAAVRAIAHVPDTDQQVAMGAYELTEDQVRAIADAAHIRVNPGQLEFFLQGFALPVR
jgi:hypothetical protein